MAAFGTYPFEIDREAGLLNYLLDYTIEGYNDPESSEYFGDTYWQVTITVEGGTSGGLSGYASESHSETVELGLSETGAVQVIRVAFMAMNTFRRFRSRTTGPSAWRPLRRGRSPLSVREHATC